jgi:hypothetical protein
MENGNKERPVEKKQKNVKMRWAALCSGVETCPWGGTERHGFGANQLREEQVANDFGLYIADV